MPAPDGDRSALAARLAPTVPAAAALVADAVDADAGEELREVLVDVDGEVVAFTSRRALFVGVGDDARRVQSFDYDAVDVRRRGEGLGVDATVVDDRLVLDVARSTFVRLGVVAQGNPPARASWLPPPAPAPRPEPAVVPEPSPQPAGPPIAPPRPPDASRPPAPAATHPPARAGTHPPARADTHPPAPAATHPPAPAATHPPAPRPVLPPPGWHPDPSGRHWWRWWDGRGWTDHVADGGAPYVDPLPPR